MLAVMNTDSCFSANSNTENINLLANPVAIASNDGPICLNGTVTLTGNTQTGATYQWYDSAFTTLLATSNVHTVSGLAAGNYTFQYIINVNGCVDTASTVVVVDPVQQAPNISSTDTTLCEGETFALSTSTNASAYMWSGPNGFSSTSQNPPVITASTATAGIYTLSVTVNGCGSADTTININVNPLPTTPTLVATNNVCQGDSIILSTGAAALNYLWLAPNGDTITTLVPRLAIGSGLYYTSGNWMLAIMNTDSCFSANSNTETITVLPNPVAIASNDGPICLNGTVTLTGNTQTGATYQWYDSAFTTLLATNNTHTVSGLAAGNYTFQYIINVNGCVDTASTVVMVREQEPAPHISGNDTVCEGELFSIFTNTVATSYNWSGPNGFTSNQQYPSAIVGSNLTAGSYTLNVTVNGCVSADTTLVIVVNPSPAQPTISGNSTLCFGDTLFLSTSATCDSFNWIGPGGSSTSTLMNPLLRTNVDNTAIPSNDSAYLAGPWSVVCVSAEGCESPRSNTINVTINPLPNAIANNNGPICNNGSVQLIGNTVSGATYEWYDSAYTTLLATSQNHTINGLVTGNYTYNYIVNVNGCVDTATTVVIVDTIQQAPSIFANDTSVCEGDMIMLGTNTSATTYSWTGPNGFSSSSQNPSAIVASLASRGTYTLSVTVNGCGSADTTINISVNPLPSTPILNAMNSNICQGDSIILSTGANAFNYLWIAPNGDTITTTIARLAIGSGQYYVSGNWQLITMNTDSCVSSNSNTATVTILANPIALANNNGPICNNGSVTLTGNTAVNGTYEWYDSAFTTLLATSNTHVITGLTTGSYTYQYILNVNGCVDTATTVVTVLPVPSAPDITSTDTVLCEGGTFNLGTSTVASAYNWNGPNGFSSSAQYPTATNASNSTAGVYTLSVIINGCVSADTSITIRVNANPTAPTIHGQSSLCFGDTIMLSTSSTCASYKWIGPGGSSSSTLANPLLNTTTNSTNIPSTDSAYLSGAWSVICVSPDGCESPQSNSINVNIIPVPDTAFAASNSPVCVGDNIILSANSLPGATYLWSGPNGFSSVSQNPVIPSAQLADSGDYSVSIIYQGCFSKVSVPTKVVVNPIPDAPLPTSSTPVCEGDTLFLFANDTGNVYSWTGPAGFTSAINNPFILNADSTNEGFYNLTVTVNGCTSPVGQTQVEVINSNFVPGITSNADTLCEGDRLILNTPGFGSTNVTYIWYGPSGVLDTTINPTYIDSNMIIADSGNYYVQVLIGTCISLPSQIKLIDVNPIPNKPNVTATTPVCEDGLIQLSTNTIANQYRWRGPNGFTSNLQNPAIIFPATLNDSGIYSLSIEEQGCFSMDSSVRVIVNAKPQTPLIFSNSPICIGDSIIVHTPNVATNYEWTYPNSTTIVSTNDTLVVFPATPGDEGTYRLRLENNGCYSDPVTIFVDIDDSASAVAFAGDDIIVCEGAPTINLGAVANGNGYWQTNSSAIIVTPFDANTPVTNLQFDSTYMFTWTLTQGSCGGVSTDSVFVNVPNYPEAIGDTLRINENGNGLIDVLVNDTTNLPVNISIKTLPNFGNASLSDTQIYYVNTSLSNNDYFIYEICLKDCPTMCDTAYVKIMIDPLLNVPDIITPNGDGKNDGFVIEGIDNYPNHELFIYNRWGNEVYFSNNYQNDWSGIRNSEELPDGTYFYILINNDTGETLLNGYITLHR